MVVLEAAIRRESGTRGSDVDFEVVAGDDVQPSVEKRSKFFQNFWICTQVGIGLFK
jgi:hypothetical protein